MTDHDDAVAVAPADESKAAGAYDFAAGQLDVRKLHEYLMTLDPDASRRAIDWMLERSLAIEFEDGEEERIIQSVLFRKRHTETIRILGHLRLQCGSLEFSDWDWIQSRPAGVPDGDDQVSESARARARLLRLVVRCVMKHEDQDLVGMKDEEKLKFWQEFEHNVFDHIGLAVQQFDRKVRQALTNRDILGKS